MSAHAILSPSSAKRWINCPPSARINAEAPRTDTVYTREGTLAHAVCELKARKHFLTGQGDLTRISNSGQVVSAKGGNHPGNSEGLDGVTLGPKKYKAAMDKFRADEMWQDEMEGHTDTYLEALKDIAAQYSVPPHVALEVKVDFSEYVPEGFGTADCLMIGPVEGVKGDVLHVIDFKYGKGVEVAAEDNPQMMLYALGALMDYSPIYDIDEVRMTIVQPRIKREPETWSLKALSLINWANCTVEPAAKLAMAGEGEFQEGEWCRFCAIRGSCRERARANLEAAQMDFREPPQLTDAEVAEALTMGQRLKQWLTDLEEYALAACLDGREIDGWKAVAGRSVRAWTDQDAAFAAARAAGIPEEMLYERKPVTLAGLEKVMGKKPFAEALAGYVTTPPGKPTLVKASDRRAAITNQPTAGEDFGGNDD